MLRFSPKGTIEYFESAEISALGFVSHAFCTRRGGVSAGPCSSLNVGDLVGDRDEDVRRNISLVEESFGIQKDRLILMRQVHGDRILVIDEDGPLPHPLNECDGLITDRPGVALGVRTADCVPVLFADPVRRIVGAVHAGWRGTALGIAAKMVEIFVEQYGSRREDLLAAIGPAIGSCCYQVDAPLFDAFSKISDRERFLKRCTQTDHWRLDNPLANRFQIEKAGVPSENISAVGQCTSCRQDLFFSHRGSNGCAGRQINFVMLNRGDVA